MPKKPVELSEIKRLLADSNLSIREIASQLKISHQALYRRIRDVGIDIGKRPSPNAYKPVASKELLIELYVNQRLSASRIGDRFNVLYKRILKDLTTYGIEKRRAGQSKRRNPDLRLLSIGETIEVPIWDGRIKSLSGFYVDAKRKNIRTAIRRKDRHTGKVTVTPHLTKEAIQEMRGRGMTLKAIAAVFFSTQGRIRRVLRGTG